MSIESQSEALSPKNTPPITPQTGLELSYSDALKSDLDIRTQLRLDSFSHLNHSFTDQLSMGLHIGSPAFLETDSSVLGVDRAAGIRFSVPMVTIEATGMQGCTLADHKDRNLVSLSANAQLTQTDAIILHSYAEPKSNSNGLPNAFLVAGGYTKHF